jgi:hypothetical protein
MSPNLSAAMIVSPSGVIVMEQRRFGMDLPLNKLRCLTTTAKISPATFDQELTCLVDAEHSDALVFCCDRDDGCALSRAQDVRNIWELGVLHFRPFPLTLLAFGNNFD